MPPVAAVTHQPNLAHVLLVEDNRVDALFVTGLFKSPAEALRCRHATRVADALQLLKTICFDVVLLDLNLDDSTGFETFEAVHNAAPGVAILVLSGADDEERAVRAAGAGAR